MEHVGAFDDKAVLVTGGTGSFGRRFVEIVLAEQRPRKLIVFSRDELKQHEMRQAHPDTGDSPMRYFIGDVRDADRLRRAFHEVDVVIHAAAMKQVPACEYNPFEAVQTNVIGARNVIDAAIDCGVDKVMALSTDKAVNPVNLYGATKLCAEKLFIHGNFYSGIGGTRLACARYGNVLASRGSIIPTLLAQRVNGVITVTDERMTRFWITLDQGVRFVISCIERMRGGEIYVPKIPSMSLMDLVKTVAPEAEVRYIGVRPGEKVHEVLVSEDEARNTFELDDMYVIRPDPDHVGGAVERDGQPLPEGFSFSSSTNASWLTPEELRELAGLD